ncbi:DUF4982 domain-containing protein [Belliella marina]|uniref:DUF4982 domain-containing protein n=1 Tax=Belliella marina TaxID=1644146 RepID=A0ABW4VFI5_9BACT
MHSKHIHWTIGILLFFTISATNALAKSESPRKKHNFNLGWKVHVGEVQHAEKMDFDDSDWKQVSLPWSWNEDEAFRLDIHSLTTGISWYRKHFTLPEGKQSQKVFLEFEGLRQGAEFYVNGKHVGRHENGAMAVGLDISGLVKPFPEENIIAVRTDSDWDYREKSTNQKYQWSDRNFNANYGGIPKNVYLHTSDRLYQTLPLYSNLGTTGVYIYADDFDIKGKSANIFAQIELKNEYETAKDFTYQVEIVDMDGKTVANFEGNKETISPGQLKVVAASDRVENLEFWSWGYGYLYDVYTRILVDGEEIDRVKTTTGFRKTAFENGMVYLNDRVLQMKGYAQRTSNEWPSVGMAVPDWLSDYSNKLMVESNANLVRWMHITPWKQDVESCDRVGLIQAMPAGDAENDPSGRRWEQRMELMRDATIYNRNNPSILFYETGNKGVSEEHMQDMRAIRDQYDPHGGRAAGSREMLDSKIAEYGGEMLYINKSAHIPMWAMEYSRDEGLRKYWDNYSPPFHKDGDGPNYKGQSARVYNRNQDSHAIENIVRWYDYWRERPGTGKRVSSGGVNIIFSDSNTHFRGAENYRRSGEVDPMRIPKDGYYAHQVIWDGWVDPENPLSHLMGHWNYAQDVTKNIYVVSNAEKVELFVNGLSKGIGSQSHRFLYTFKDIAFEPGEIKAVSYDENGEIISEDRRITTGAPKRIQLSSITHPNGLRADGHDLALVQFEIVDENGNRCPTALNMVNFELEGPAEWRGGIAQGPDNYILSKALPAEGGVNRVLIRSSTEAGKISIVAKSEGLESANLELQSSEVKHKNGLAETLPGDGLPSNLDKGPTPTSSSITPTRTPIMISKATAGANEENAIHSFDDNERTGWSNDGNIETGWIKYELEREAEISEVTMKLNDWRNKSYLIIISVDGKEVFKGNTDRSLGYITYAFTPTHGKTLKVQLIGAGTNEDAYDIVEITGQKEPAGDGNGRSNGQISILEIEIYEGISSNSDS